MNKPTIMSFIGIRTLIYLAIVLIGMCVIFTYTVDRARHDAARHAVSSNARRASRHIMKPDDGTVAVEEDILEELDESTIAVIDSKGKLISGELPAELGDVASEKPVHDHFQEIKRNGKEFFIYDHEARRLHHDHVKPSEKGKNEDNKPEGGASWGGARDPELKEYYVRAVLCEEDFDTIYNRIQMFFYSFIILLVIAALFGGIWLYRKTTVPIREMCDDVKKLAEDPDYEGHIDNVSLFYETDVMTDAYNKLVDRNKRLINQQEEFNENVSHELRTPVAVIRSEVELLQDMYDDSLSEEAENALEVIRNQSDRINAMITELKYMAKMDRENFALRKETIDLSDIAESVCEDLEDVTLRGCRFIYHWEHSGADVDVALIMVAVRNLILNAVKFSPEGSAIELYSGTDGDMAYLKVTDHGIGISEESLERVFEPYYQEKTERNSDGFGLGLALTKKIVEKHNGTVTVESEIGKGSSFTIMLPIQ